MTFQTDKQTIKDIELYAERKGNPSIFSFYNKTVTKGGESLLYEIFNSPTSDIEFLENRKSEIEFFFKNDCSLNLNSRSIDFIEYYLSSRRVPLKPNLIDATFNAISNKLKPDNDYYTITEGIIHISQLLTDADAFIRNAESLGIKSSIRDHLDEMDSFLKLEHIRSLIDDPPEKAKDLSFNFISKLDHLFRQKEKESFRNFLVVIYEIDFLQTMAGLMKSKGLSLPEYTINAGSIFEVTDSFHPFLSNPINNSFEFTDNNNLCFLTGPNMSGKSTFLKTMGLLVYLSHLGLPVPAKKFKTSIYDGLFTTINLNDNLNLGYSHFYAEINRIKEIATKLLTTDNLVIIFDELFRGTNVKDAYDASLSIITSLSKIKNTRFFVSTHILEVADKLGDTNQIIFKCFESEMINGTPEYPYTIKSGISSERVGMLILKRENILQILQNVLEKQTKHCL